MLVWYSGVLGVCDVGPWPLTPSVPSAVGVHEVFRIPIDKRQEPITYVSLKSL